MFHFLFLNTKGPAGTPNLPDSPIEDFLAPKRGNSLLWTVHVF